MITMSKVKKGMVLKNNAMVTAFLKCIPACKGKVFFDTSDGDHLVLNSVLSQFVFIIALQNKEMSYQIYFDPADAPLLLPFLAEASPM